MYILLNIKDSDKAAEAISLLIKNNFLSMVTGQELRDVCTDCAARSAAPSTPVPCPSSAPAPAPAPSLTPPPKPKSIPFAMASHPRKRKLSPPEPTLAPMFEEPMITIKEEHQPITIHDEGVMAIPELETSTSSMPEFGIGVLTKLKRAPKRKPTEAKEGKQGLNCAFCAGFITWGGSTPMANIERHIKLHASREQFSCSICSQHYSRRYEVKKHIETHHPFELDVAEIVDHGQELRDEYDSLWVKCFPEIDFEEYKARKKNYYVNPSNNFLC